MPIKKRFSVMVIVNAVKLILQSGRNTPLVSFSCFRNTIKHDRFLQKYANIYHIILFEELSFQNTLIKNLYALLFLLVPRRASQENLLVRQVLYMYDLE